MRQGILLGHFYATGYMVWRDLSHNPVTSLLKYPPLRVDGLVELASESQKFTLLCRSNYSYLKRRKQSIGMK